MLFYFPYLLASSSLVQILLPPGFTCLVHLPGPRNFVLAIWSKYISFSMQGERALQGWSTPPSPQFYINLLVSTLLPMLPKSLVDTTLNSISTMVQPENLQFRGFSVLFLAAKTNVCPCSCFLVCVFIVSSFHIGMGISV